MYKGKIILTHYVPLFLTLIEIKKYTQTLDAVKIYSLVYSFKFWCL